MNSRESSNEPQDVDPPGNDETLSNDEENPTKLDEENIEMKGGDDDNEMQTNDTTEDQPKSSRLMIDFSQVRKDDQSPCTWIHACSSLSTTQHLHFSFCLKGPVLI